MNDDDKTPVARPAPCLNPENRAFVAAMRMWADTVEAASLRVTSGMRDLATVIQLSATEPASPDIRRRVVGFAKDYTASAGLADLALEEAS